MAVLGFGSPMMWRLGFAVAWLVGSWLFGPKQNKNKIFDPGAEEMPRWNTALRGITIPVFFGTNRVSSQIVWQHDYTVVRKDSSKGGGGGKFGGSGGGKGAAQTGSISYEYYWDLIYHLGMVPEKYSLIKGWVGAERINNEAMAAIIGGSSGEIVFTDVKDANRKDNEKTTMSFQDSFYYSGSGPGLADDSLFDGWTEIQTDEGVEVRWPHTTYVAFKQLFLGSYPSVPQMSFEIGPGEPEIDYDNLVDYHVSGGNTLQAHSSLTGWQVLGHTPFIVGDDNNKYYVISAQGAIKLLVIDPTTHAVSLHSEYSAAEVKALITGYSARVNSIQYLHCGVIDPFNYIAGCWLQNDAFDGHGIGLLKVNASGVLECVGAGVGGNVSLSDSIITGLFIGVAGNRTGDDPIIFIGNRIPLGNDLPTFLMMPSVNQLVGNDVDMLSWGAGGENWIWYFHALLGSNYTTADGYRTISPSFFLLPYLDGLTIGTKLYTYIGPSEIKAVDDGLFTNTVISTQGATYPDGFFIVLDLGTISFDTGSPPTFPGAATYVQSGLMYQYGTQTEVFPFDDTDLYADGVTIDSKNRADYDPHPFITKLTQGPNAGGYIVIWSALLPILSGADMVTGSGYDSYMRGRVMFYNLLEERFDQLKTIAFEPFNRVDDLGEGANDTVRPLGHMLSYHYELDELYFGLQSDGSSTSWVEQHVVGRVGDLYLGGGSDVVPPYIIREILTNDWFGIGLTDDQIDDTTYQAAVDYCVANDYKVSMQVRREESVLNIIDDILSTYGGFLVISNGKVKFKQLEYLDGLGSSVRTIDNSHFIRDRENEPPVKVTKGARQDTFNKVKVNYYDRNLEYAQNQVEEADEVDQDFNGIRPREFPAIFVMNETMARKMALRALYSNLYSRDTYNFSMGWKDSDLEPGDVITLVDSFHSQLAGGVTARIIEWKERERGKFDITAKQEHEYIQDITSVFVLNVTSASILNKISAIPYPKDFTMYELPKEFYTGAPHAIVSWASYEFAAGARLWLSADGVSYAITDEIEPFQINGEFLTGLPNDDSVAENIEVIIAPKSDYYYTSSIYYSQTLAEVEQAGRASKTSLIWCGSEMMAYQGVTLIGENKYRFSKVFRAWGGTRAHAHNSGDVWYKQGGGIFAAPVNEDQIGTTVYYKVQPINLGGAFIDINSITAKQYEITGEYFKPRPVGDLEFESNRKKKTVYVGSTIDIAINWEPTYPTVGYGALGYGKGSLGYGADANVNSVVTDYRVEIVGSGDTIVRSVSQSSASFLYTSSMNFEDNGAWRGNVAVKVTPYNQYGDAPKTSVLSLELWT